ncbi:hypothetical protein ACVWXQ_006977 [Bradyrhizobium sp. S3.14.4]
MASARYLRRHRPGDNAGPGRHCLCSCIGPAGHLRFVRNDRAAAGLRAVRPKPHSRPWPGLGAGGNTPWSHRSLGSGRSPAGRDTRGHDGDCLRDGLYPGRRRAPWLYHRASLEADTLRVYERNCPDRIDQPAAQALRLFHRERGATAKPVGDCQRDPWGADKLGRVRDWPRHVDRDPASQEQQAGTGPSDCGRWGYARRRGA